MVGWFAGYLDNNNQSLLFASGTGKAGMNGIVTMLTKQLNCTETQKRKQLEREETDVQLLSVTRVRELAVIGRYITPCLFPFLDLLLCFRPCLTSLDQIF